MENKQELDWERAKNWLAKIRDMYTEIGVSGLPALQVTINPLLIQYEKGIRTRELYDNIMSLE